MTRRTLGRLALILVGYVAAAAVGATAVWLKDWAVSAADLSAMSGMSAFGDAVTFLAVGAVTAIVPTMLLFKLIGTAPLFWRLYSLASVTVSSTAVLGGILLQCTIPPGHDQLQMVRSVAVLRVLAAPLFFLAVVPGVLPAAGSNRKTSLVACAFELSAMGSFALMVLLHGH